MIGACKLNNKMMRNLRKDAVYQCLAVDLAMLGVISREECEMLIGSGIPDGLILPNGEHGKIISEADLPEDDMVKTEETDTEETDTEETDTEETDTEETDTEETDDDQRGTESDN